MELLTIFILSLIVGSIGVFYLINRRLSYWSNKGIPYMRKWSIIGCLSDVFLGCRAFPNHILHLYSQFNDAKYHGMIDHCTPVLMIKDLDLIKEICVKNFDSFPNHKSFIDAIMDPIMGRNIFSLRDERWREMRHTLSPTFTASRMKFMFELISECSERFVQYFIDHPEMTNSLDMKDAFTRYTNDVIATTAFGISVNSLKNRNNEFYLHGKHATHFYGPFQMFKFFGARFMPGFMRLMGIRFLPHSTDEFFRKLITQTVKERGERKIIRPDMIDILMRKRNSCNAVQITDDDIIGQAFIFFIAGFETVSSFLTMLSHLLAFHQDVQEKLRNEVDKVMKSNDGKLDYDHLMDLKYMNMVMNETLRLYPPTLVTDRVCSRPFKLPPSLPGCPELIVEKETICWLPIYALHHDPKYFTDPNKFDPERFNDVNRANIVPYTFMPFGAGPRKCVGERFALIETKIIIANLLQKFIIKPTAKSREKVDFQKRNFNIAAECGTWLSFQCREK